MEIRRDGSTTTAKWYKAVFSVAGSALVAFANSY
jgi:hypothetical protein